ncbi:hypothetical protein [Janthinobacterium sp.]|uniref:immunity protein Imm33 domain-containing protein n=1 Tax=Janthinobacterium sp. TaxID=1871054 RepID=UPI0025C1A9D5|nr:hypothetical protein [Janthinobacterium sp.]
MNEPMNEQDKEVLNAQRKEQDKEMIDAQSKEQDKEVIDAQSKDQSKELINEQSKDQSKDQSSAQIHENQRRICDKYGLPAQAPEDMVALAIGSLDQSPIYGTRIDLPENGTISWFIHCGAHSDASDFYQPLHAAHLTELLPQVLAYLALPSGTKFILDRAGYEDVWREG